MPKEAGKKESATPARESQPPRIYELAAREKKAATLAEMLHRYHVTAHEAEAADDRDWELAARCAKCNPPSLETRAMVIRMLREKETKA